MWNIRSPPFRYSITKNKWVYTKWKYVGLQRVKLTYIPPNCTAYIRTLCAIRMTTRTYVHRYVSVQNMHSTSYVYTVQMYCMWATLWTDLLYVHTVRMYIHTYVRTCICSNPSITPSSYVHTPPSHLRLEGAVQLCNEGALSPQSQGPSLHKGCLNVVILNHNILL